MRSVTVYLKSCYQNPTLALFCMGLGTHIGLNSQPLCTPVDKVLTSSFVGCLTGYLSTPVYPALIGYTLYRYQQDRQSCLYPE